MNRRNSLIAAVLVILVAAAFFISRPANKHEIAEGFNFHPDAVHSFSWTAGGKTFSFKRTGRGQPWTPDVDQEAVQNKLNLLGTVKAEDGFSGGASGDVVLEVGFAPGNEWKGVYSGGSFAWISGTKKGKGFRADKDLEALFAEGSRAFDNRTWNWCTSRPKNLLVQPPGSKPFALEEEKGTWWYSDKSLPNRVRADATTVEKWLGKYCQMKIDRYRDIKNFPASPDLTVDMFIVVFADGSKLELRHTDDVWLKPGTDFAFTSRAFESALSELEKTPKQ